MKTKLYLVLIVLFILPGAMTAQTHNWTGNGGDNDWFNAANWDAGTVPMTNSSVSISGTVVVTISGNPAEAYTIDILNDGTLEMESDLSTGSIITISENSTFKFISGTLSGSGILNYGLLQLQGNLSKRFDQTTITNHAQFLVSNSNQIEVLATTITNNAMGVIDVASVGGILDQGTSSTLNNAGVIMKSYDGVNPIGNFYLILNINNTGIIDVAEDETFLILGGNIDLNNLESGIMQGKGIYDITANFTNTGALSPGGSEVGTMHITNFCNLTPPGTLNIDITGTNAGMYDVIEVTGTPILDGNIEVTTGNINLTEGDQFIILTATNGIGTCNFPAQIISDNGGASALVFDVLCQSNSIVLEFVSELLSTNDLVSGKTAFYVQPNPVSDKATFVFSSELIPAEETSLVIYNYQGRQVLEIQGFTPENNLFQRGNLSGGIYFAQLQVEGRVLATTKMVLE